MYLWIRSSGPKQTEQKTPRKVQGSEFSEVSIPLRIADFLEEALPIPYIPEPGSSKEVSNATLTSAAAAGASAAKAALRHWKR